MIKVITSVKNQLIKDLVSLKSSSVKKKENRFLIEGEDLVKLAYEANLIDMILVLEENNKYSNVEQIITSEQVIEKLSNNKSPSKIIGVAHFKENELSGERIIFLDNVQDPGNVGTIIRTALSFSYSAVILGNNSASIYNDKVIQSTKGALFKIPVFENISLKELKEKGYKVVSTALKGAINYKEVELNDKFVLVFGNEGQGICEETLNLSDLLIKINMDHIDSLNVAIAAGILMNHYRGE